MNQEVMEQILMVRDSGETNMFDVRMVMEIAMREGFAALVEFLPEHKSEYAYFILTGKVKSDER